MFPIYYPRVAFPYHPFTYVRETVPESEAVKKLEEEVSRKNECIAERTKRLAEVSVECNCLRRQNEYLRSILAKIGAFAEKKQAEVAASEKKTKK